MILILQLINSISRVLQKLLKYFNDTAISTSFVLPSAEVYPVLSTLNLNKRFSPGKLTKLPSLSNAGSSL